MRNASCFNRRRYSQSNCQSLDGELSPSSVRWLWESPREKAPLGQRRAAPRRLLAFWLLEQLRESLGSSGRRSAVDTRCMNGVAEPFLNWHYSHLYHRRRVKGPSSGASAALLWTVTFVPEWNFDSVLFFFFFLPCYFCLCLLALLSGVCPLCTYTMPLDIYPPPWNRVRRSPRQSPRRKVTFGTRGRSKREPRQALSDQSISFQDVRQKINNRKAFIVLFALSTCDGWTRRHTNYCMYRPIRLQSTNPFCS